MTRSSGAYSISIWTRNFNKIEHNASWSLLNGEKENVLVAGSGTVWGDLYGAAAEQGRVVVGGNDETVGLGGFIQGGGHGPLTSTYGLATHQVLQATVVTTEGRILVANDGQNQDLFWAVRGGGAGQYGVITEYVLKTHPPPELVTIGTLQIAPPTDSGNLSTNATWDAAATIFSSIPDLMDSGLAGVTILATGRRAMSLYPSLKELPSGVVMNQMFFGYNVTPAAMALLVDPVITHIRSHSNNSTLAITWAEPAIYRNYTSFSKVISGTSNAAGGGGLMSTRLLGRAELSELSQHKLPTSCKGLCGRRTNPTVPMLSLASKAAPVLQGLLSPGGAASIRPIVPPTSTSSAWARRSISPLQADPKRVWRRRQIGLRRTRRPCSESGRRTPELT